MTIGLPPGEIHLWLSRLDARADAWTFTRRVLAKYTGGGPDALMFERGEHGKPALASDGPRPEFNISHSGDWLLCAVSGGPPIGADLQYTDTGRDTMRLARRYFSAPEVALLESLPAAEREEHFYDLWSLKEAAVKSRGGALPSGLGALGFELHFDGAAGGRIVPVPAAAHGGAGYCLLELLPHYRTAICWRGAGQSAGAPVLRLLDEDGQVSAPTVRALS